MASDGGCILLLRGGKGRVGCGLLDDREDAVVEMDIRLLLLALAMYDALSDRPLMLDGLSIELGEIDLRTCGTSITEGFPENITETTLAVTSCLLHSSVGDGRSSLLESYSKSEKSPEVDDASSSEERYSSWWV